MDLGVIDLSTYFFIMLTSKREEKSGQDEKNFLPASQVWVNA